MHDNKLLASNYASKAFMEAWIRIGLVALVAYLCFRVFDPFLSIVLWALILAIALYPIHQRLAKRLGGRQGRASTLMVLIAVFGMGIPIAVLGNSLALHLQQAHLMIENEAVSIDPPDPKVADWPIIGEKVYDAWEAAAVSLPEFVEEYEPQLKSFSSRLVSTATSTLASVFLLMGAFIIAGIMMSFGKSGTLAMGKIINRIVGPKEGPKLQTLCTATVRSVSVGVLGVAVLQALLFGIGFLMAGIPFAGVLALIVLFAGIVQLPALIVALPAIAFLWTVGDASVGLNVFFTIYFIVAGLADNVLKPLLLGRGVDAPMPVILIGALGGMVHSGIIGLFVGAVLLAVGYQIFMGWVHEVDGRASQEDLPTDGDASPSE